MTVEERRVSLLRELLLRSPSSYSIIDILEVYFISESALTTDEVWLGKELASYGLQLQKKHRSLAILGAERMSAVLYLTFINAQIKWIWMC